MAEIVVVDIGPAIAGGSEDKIQNIVQQVGDAIATVGFLQIVGHGVPLDLILRAHESMRFLDDLSDADRESLASPALISRGLRELECVDGSLATRSLQFITYDTVEDAQAAGAVRGHPEFFVPNKWPAHDARFRALWTEYRAALRPVARVMTMLFSRALAVRAGYFDDYLSDNMTMVSCNWFPCQLSAEINGEPRVLGPKHADGGVMAILHQAGNYDGLQVLTSDEEWLTVPTRDDAFVVNLGHVMGRWTNANWPVTLHRVLAGPEATSQRSSIAYFVWPNVDAVIEPISSLIGTDGPRFEPTTYIQMTLDFNRRYEHQGFAAPDDSVMKRLEDHSISAD